jgi:tryptophan 7-halogenase
MNKGIKQIAIIGSGIELQMSAAILSVALQSFGIKIVVLAIPSNESASLVETTGPEFSALCQILGLVERDVMRQCQATFRLGSQYIGANHNWFVSFAHLGLKAEQDDFEQGLFQIIRQQNINNLNPWCAASAAAVAGKFAIAGKDRPDLQRALDYGVHLDATEYANILAKICSKQKVNWLSLSQQTLQVKRDELGNIVEVKTEQHNVVADFWFDLRAEQTNGQGQNWQNTLPLTYHAQWSIPRPEVLFPYTQLQQLHGNWLKISPLRNKSVVDLFAVQQECDLGLVEQQITALGLGPNQPIDWAPIKFKVLSSPWQGNCLYLGGASIQLGDIAFSSLQCVQAALVQFIDFFPDFPIGEHNRRHYNLVWQRFVRDARDYSAAHFLPHTGHYSEVADVLPQSLLQRLQLFERLGRLTPMESDAVTEGQWYHLLFGLGLRPQLSSVVLSKMNEHQLQTATQQVAQSIAGLVAGMPSHEQYLARFYPPNLQQ